MTNPSSPLINNEKNKPAGWPYKVVLACLFMILALSVNPLKAEAGKYDTDPAYTKEDPEGIWPESEYTEEEPNDPEAEYTEEPEVPVVPVYPVNPVNPVNPSNGNTTGSNLVTYTAATISKGGYSTPIWKQHSIWKKRSSASRHGCGICVTSMALQLSGVPSSPNRVLKQTNRSENRCQSLKPKQAVKVLKKNHVAVKPVNTRAYSRKQCMYIMKNALNKGKMVMALVRGKPFSNNTHWVLIVGYDAKGRIVVANSSYGNRNRCKKTRKQYHLVNWKQIQKKIIRDSINYSAFIIVG